jgi:hypothetical protein
MILPPVFVLSIKKLTNSEEPVVIPEEEELFGYIVLSLLENAKGASSARRVTEFTKPIN